MRRHGTHWLLVALVALVALGGCGRGERGGRPEPGPAEKAVAPSKSTAPKATTVTVAPTSKATPATPGSRGATGAYAAGVGWDVPPYSRDYLIAGAMVAVGLACASGLPPGAQVSIRVGGQTGALSPVGGVVLADGSVEVAFGLQRPGEIVWEFVSITAREGVLPRGRAATWGTSDQPCEAR